MKYFIKLQAQWLGKWVISSLLFNGGPRFAGKNRLDGFWLWRENSTSTFVKFPRECWTKMQRRYHQCGSCASYWSYFTIKAALDEIFLACISGKLVVSVLDADDYNLKDNLKEEVLYSTCLWDTGAHSCPTPDDLLSDDFNRIPSRSNSWSLQKFPGSSSPVRFIV